MPDETPLSSPEDSEHWPCQHREVCPRYPWHATYEALVAAVTEEANALRTLVREDDASCPARASRQQRLASLEWVLVVADELKRWEW